METQIKVTIVYPDNSTWFAGQFKNMEAAQAWMDEEQTRPYWNKDNTFEIEEVIINENIK
jgi:hypothetical protein